jgi:peptidoglycan/LPS O-acetylase OafA/YrhL
MHFRVLDSWRGIAALLVALFHLNVYSAIYRWISSATDICWWISSSS